MYDNWLYFDPDPIDSIRTQSEFIKSRRGREYDSYQIDPTTIGTDVFDIFSHPIDILIKVSMLTLCFDTLPIIFDQINSNSDKLSEFKRDDINTSNIITIRNNFYKITGAAILVGFFLNSIYLFITQIMDILSLSVTLSIEVASIIVAIIQLVLTFSVSLVDAFHLYMKARLNVCGVFCSLFSLFVFFFFLSLYMFCY